jgi:septum formation protein
MSARRAILLASRSPRRAELLRQMGLAFRVVDANVDETPQREEIPEAYVVRLAKAKARAGWLPGTVTLGADTTVVIDDEILGKPCGQREAEGMLARLSGRTHEVITGVAAFDGERLESRAVSTIVEFGDIPERVARAYWQTGEPNDKAGGYGIQGIGGIFAERIEGSYSAIVGLPVRETEALLQLFNIDTWSMRIDGRRTPD